MRKRLLFFAAAVVLIGLVFAIPTTRLALLRGAGEWLVVDEPLEHADLIIIAVDAEAAGVLEAVDLVGAGYADRVALFPDPPSAVDREFLRRGVPYRDEAAISAAQLRSLGIKNLEVIPWPVSGTEEEGVVIRRWADQTHLRKIIFVSMADHARRSRRILERGMRGSDTKVIVKYSRYSEFDPHAWWRSRGGIRIEIIETEKLLLDVLGHLFS